MQKDRFVGYKSDNIDTLALLLQGDFIVVNHVYVRVILSISGDIFLESPTDTTKIGSLLNCSPLTIKLYDNYKNYHKEVVSILERHDRLPLSLIVSYRKFKPSKTVIKRLRKKGIKFDLYKLEQLVRSKYGIT